MENQLDIFIIFWSIGMAYLCVYYLLLFLTWSRNREDIKTVLPNPPVSVVICAKNEAANLQNYLPAILDQDYPEFEVVILDDHSTDSTIDIVQDLMKHHKHLRYEKFDKSSTGLRGKKGLLVHGVSIAKYKHLLFTDADCMVSGRRWISAMTSPCDEKTRFVLGFAPLNVNNGWLGSFESFENAKTAATYLGHAMLGIPYMGVGRNMLYVHQDDDLLDMYQRGGHLASGDDDLLVNQLANATNTKYVLESDAFMVSEAPPSWKVLLKQKTRQLGAGGFYRTRDKTLLGAVMLFEIYGFVLLLIFAAWNLLQFWMIFIYMVKFALKGLMYFQVDKKLNTTVGLRFVFFDLMHIFLSIGLYLNSLLFKKKIDWK